MERIPRQALHRPRLGCVSVVATETMACEAGWQTTHTVIVSVLAEGYRLSTLEMAYGLSAQLHVPRYNVCVTRHKAADGSWQSSSWP